MDWTGNDNKREIYFLINQRMMIRRLKSEVLTQLPSKRRQKISILTDLTISKKIGKLLNKVKNWDEDVEERQREEDRRKEELSKRINNYEFDKLMGELKDIENPYLNALHDRHGCIVNAYKMTGEAKTKGIVEFVAT